MLFLNYATIVDPLLRDVRLQTIEFSGMRAGDRVLDVCCGTGDQAFYYAKAGIIATGIDSNPNMLKLIRKDKRNQVFGNIAFQLADAQNLPFRDSFFDYTSISFALHEKERIVRDEVISEMKRVVKKGGALIFIDFQAPLPQNLFPYLIKAIEFIAGREHYRNFNDYIEQGGLNEILKKNQLAEEKRDCLNDGLIMIVKARKP